MAKKYVWLKLKEDFFQQRTIKKLRKIAGGDTYTIIYLKLQLLSLTDEGKLFYEGIEDTFAEEMALAIDEEIENVKITLMFLEKNGLLERVDADEYTLLEVINSIGSESAVAERVRKHREKQKVLQCNTDVTESNLLETKGNTEKEKEEDKEIDKDIYIKKSVAHNEQSINLKNNIAKLISIAALATGLDKSIVMNIIKPANFREIEFDLLFRKISESDFLQGKLDDRKPIIAHFTERNMLNKVFADRYKNKSPTIPEKDITYDDPEYPDELKKIMEGVS
ncbi:phage replisome organizer N-terminal domain-containing protein [Fusobacterium varium]